MDLWIRSQSKQTLLKVSKIYLDDGIVFASTESEFDERVGIYSTNKRALEVLDEIQDRIMTLNMISTANTKDELIDIANALGVAKIQGALIPYQMPKE